MIPITVNGLKHANILNIDLNVVSVLIRRVGVAANAPVIVIVTSCSLLDLAALLRSAVITLNVCEQLTAILRAK